MVFEILNLRAYAEAKRAVEAKDSSEENTTEWQREVVFEVEAELIRRQKVKR